MRRSRCQLEGVALHGHNDCDGRALSGIAQKEEQGEQSGKLARVKRRERWRCAPIVYVGAGSSDLLKGLRRAKAQIPEGVVNRCQGKFNGRYLTPAWEMAGFPSCVRAGRMTA
jgi:hypothetical protein